MTAIVLVMALSSHALESLPTPLPRVSALAFVDDASASSTRPPLWPKSTTPSSGAAPASGPPAPTCIVACNCADAVPRPRRCKRLFCNSSTRIPAAVASSASSTCASWQEAATLPARHSSSSAEAASKGKSRTAATAEINIVLAIVVQAPES